MKTAIQEVIDEIETEQNNGVEISQKQLFKMLLKAREKEKQQIIEAHRIGVFDCKNHEQYYKETVENNEPNF